MDTPVQTTPTTTWVPSRKWAVSVITALGAVVTMYFTSGSWDVEESISLSGIIFTSITTYLIPNPGPSN